MSRVYKPISVRLPGEVKEELKKLAAENHRSLNGEITNIIEQHLEKVAAEGHGQ